MRTASGIIRCLQALEIRGGRQDQGSSGPDDDSLRLERLPAGGLR
jgi:hypothetical protein